MTKAFRVGLALAFVLAGSLISASPVAAATFTVNRIGDAADLNLANAACDTSTNSGNQCTLRAAIQEANDTPGTDIITFNITSTSKTIAPTTPLPPIKEAVTINGYSQTGASTNTKAGTDNAVLKVILDGLNAGGGAIGLHVTASNTVIRGLVIQRFDEAGTVIEGNSNTVAGNFIGTTAAGDAARGNSNGVEIRSGEQNLIGGTTTGARNLISGNLSFGVAIEGLTASENYVQGNFIGTTKSGSGDLGNASYGVRIFQGANNNIGGSVAGARNVISGNEDGGISIEGGPVTGNYATVTGNYIGTTASGLAARGNQTDGIDLRASRVTIGGTSALARNVISANGGAGIRFSGAFSEATILGNYIGTDKTGLAALGNAGAGINLLAPTATIGGSTAGAGNVISANGAEGITVVSSNNVIRGNKIGSNANSTGDLGNDSNGIGCYSGNATQIGGSASLAGNLIRANGSHGIFVFAGCVNPTIQNNAIAANAYDGINVGETSTITANDVANNVRHGIRVVSSGDGVRMSANETFGNGGLGIDLQGGTENGFGTTTNDTADPDTGANNLQNFPVLTAVHRRSDGITAVYGNLNSNPNTQFRVEVFTVNTDSSGHGEGWFYKGFQNMTTGSTGNVSFHIGIAGIPVGQVVTVTATSVTAGNTSEFSANMTVIAEP